MSEYRVWIPNREDESEAATYSEGPGIAAEQYAEACYYSDDCPSQVEVHVRRLSAGEDHDEVLVFDVWVEHDPTFHSALRKATP
jgi:hypothetical protein